MLTALTRWVRAQLGLDVIERLCSEILEVLRNMAQITQKQLDDLALSLTDSNQRIGAEIRKIREENPELNLDGLTAAIAESANLVPSAVTPGVPPVAADSETPLVPDPESNDAGGDSVELPEDGSTPTL